MVALDEYRMSVFKAGYIAILERAAKQTSASSVYFVSSLARNELRASAKILFQEFEYPSEVHYPVMRVGSIQVDPLDWVDGHDGGAGLARVRQAVLDARDVAERDYETVMREHLDFLNSVPREYVLATLSKSGV